MGLGPALTTTGRRAFATTPGSHARGFAAVHEDRSRFGVQLRRSSESCFCVCASDSRSVTVTHNRHDAQAQERVTYEKALFHDPCRPSAE